MGFVVGSLNLLYTLSMSAMTSSLSSMSNAPTFSCTQQEPHVNDMGMHYKQSFQVIVFIQ